MEEILQKLLEKYDEGDGSEIVLNMIYAGCISSDTLTSLDACYRSIGIIKAFKKATSNADIGVQTRKDWNMRIDSAFELLNDTISMFSSLK